MSRRLIFVCNALDDGTRLQRGIVTDSPAASRKVLLTCGALRRAGVHPVIVSLGRGRPDGSGRYFGRVVRRIKGVPVIYMPFVHRRGLSELLSLFAPVGVLLRLNRCRGTKTVVFYNRMLAYVPVLVTAAALRFRTVLDLEDGEVRRRYGMTREALSGLVHKTFDALCSGGALLACTTLTSMTSLRPTLTYYGTIEMRASGANWSDPQLVVLFGGTVSRDTGAMLLVEAIRILRREKPEWSRRIRFEITGKGDCIDLFTELSREAASPKVTVHGRTTDGEYRLIIDRSHIGLALKPNRGELANSTFPSKVVELASAGLLVLTTDISDVRSVLGAGAVYLDMETSSFLVERLQWIVNNPRQASEIARAGTDAVLRECSPSITGRNLAGFLFGCA